GIAAEIAKPDAATEFVRAGIEAFERIDALINIASDYPTEQGHWQRWQNGGGVTDADWDYYDSNFTLYRNVIVSLLKMQEDCAGLSIINFGDARSMQFFDESICDPYEGAGGILTVSTEQAKAVGLARIARLAPPRHVNPYTLAKIDVAYLTRKLAIDLGSRKIRINTLALGPMLPPPDSDGKNLDVIAAQTCLNKWGGTEPVVQAVDYLLENNYVTGEILKVDGGLYLHQRFK
ncbi:MAG: SDR family oxidoreductase, partial [Planctomycetota bacterium]